MEQTHQQMDVKLIQELFYYFISNSKYPCEGFFLCFTHISLNTHTCAHTCTHRCTQTYIFKFQVENKVIDLSAESGSWVSGNWPWTFTSICLPPQATSSLRATWTASTTLHLQPRRSLCLQIAEHSQPLATCRSLAHLCLFPWVLGWNFYLCWTVSLGLTDTHDYI